MAIVRQLEPLTEEERNEIYAQTVATIEERDRQLGRDEANEAVFLAGVMSMFDMFGLWGQLPAGFVFGPLSGRSLSQKLQEKYNRAERAKQDREDAEEERRQARARR